MSRKNVWRRRGRLEFKRATGRYSDGTLGDWDVLWVRTAKGPHGRGVAYCDHSASEGLSAGLGCYLYPRPLNPATLGKAMRRLALYRFAEINHTNQE